MSLLGSDASGKSSTTWLTCFTPFPMFFWHPHPTFDFWHHHSKHKHHDRPTPPPLGGDSDESPSYEVFLEPAENPQELSLARRWLAVICISTASICVTWASSMVRVCSFVTFLSSKVALLSRTTGGVRGGACSKRIPCEQGSCHSRRESLRVGSGPRPACRGSNVRDLWAQYRLSRLIYPVLPVHVPRCIRT